MTRSNGLEGNKSRSGEIIWRAIAVIHVFKMMIWFRVMAVETGVSTQIEDIFEGVLNGTWR